MQLLSALGADAVVCWLPAGGHCFIAVVVAGRHGVCREGDCVSHLAHESVGRSVSFSRAACLQTFPLQSVFVGCQDFQLNFACYKRTHYSCVPLA